MPDPKKILKEFGVILLCFAILAYIVIHLSINFSNGITVEPAYSVSLEDSFTADGYIMRDEELVALDKSGIIVPAVSEGERVSIGTALFSIYSGENDAGIESEIAAIDEKIEILEKSGSETGSFVSEIGRIDEKISSGIADALVYTAANSLSRASNITDDILINMNKRWLITKGESSFESKITELQNRKLELQAALAGTPERYYAKSTGYFSGSMDGYESVFDASLLDTMTTADFEEMINAEPDTEAIAGASGKIIRNFKWRVLCGRTKREANEFVVGAEYPVIFPYSYNAEIEMTLEKVITETDGDDAVMVFSTSYMPQDFNYTRKQEIEVVKERLTGLKVRKTAMRLIEGDIRSESEIAEANKSTIPLTPEKEAKIAGPHKGVYILEGNTIRFRYAEEICDLGDYYIIDATEESYLNREGKPKVTEYERLSLYDQVVVEGKDLYVGKIIE